MIALGDAFIESKGKVSRDGWERLGSNLIDAGWYDPSGLYDKLARARHNSRANVAFCDGHIEGMRFNNLFAESEAAFRRWNADHESHQELRVRH